MYSEGLILAKRYKLCKIYGQGSFAQVWLAEDIKTQKTVAVKICHIPTSIDCEQEREKFIQHFYDEIALMMHIHSYYVVEILNYGKEQETVTPYTWFYYIVMEKMNSTISNILEQQRKNERKLFTLDEFLRYAINLLIGLRDIHTQGIIHRDIKPSNLFLSSDDIAMIGDLGIAKMRKGAEETQSMFGTVGYAAPELFASEHEATVQSDIFSMGISFYEMLTTKHPCNENGSFYLSRETVQRLLSGQFYSLSELRPDLPENLVQIIYKMIAINPQERARSVAEVLKQFQQIRLSILNNYIELSNSYIQANNPNEAVSVLKKSIALCPEFVKSYNRLGNLYYDYAKYYKAIKYFNKSLSLRKSKYSYNALGLCFYELKRYDEAIVSFSHAIKQDIEFAEAYNNRGLAYYQKKEYNRAIQNFNHVLSLKGNREKAYHNRGLTYMEQGEYQKAIYDFSHSIQANENPEAYYSRALAYQKVKQYQKALEDWTKVLSYTPKDWVVYCYRAMIYKYKKDYSSAYNDFQHALKLSPDNPKIISHIKKISGYLNNKKK